MPYARRSRASKPCLTSKAIAEKLKFPNFSKKNSKQNQMQIARRSHEVHCELNFYLANSVVNAIVISREVAKMVEIIERSSSVAIGWEFTNLRAARKYLLHDRGATLVKSVYFVRDIYGQDWAHREYKAWGGTRFLVRIKL